MVQMVKTTILVRGLWLRFSAKSCSSLQSSVPSKRLNFHTRGWTCENLRLSVNVFWARSVTLVRPWKRAVIYCPLQVRYSQIALSSVVMSLVKLNGYATPGMHMDSPVAIKQKNWSSQHLLGCHKGVDRGVKTCDFGKGRFPIVCIFLRFMRFLTLS